jgi:TPR repeat protein
VVEFRSAVAAVLQVQEQNGRMETEQTMWQTIKWIVFIVIVGYCIHFLWVNGWELSAAKMGLGDPYAVTVKAGELVHQQKVGEALPLLEYENGRGDLAAREILAKLYEHGNGVPKDSQKASALFKDLSGHGDPYADYQLGAMYYCGRLGRPDEQLAHLWFAKAAAAHYSPAISAQASIEAHQQLQCESDPAP